MKRMNIRLTQFTLAGLLGVGCLFASERASQISSGTLLSTAEARVGRPLTPMSYAGVARRTTRRAVAVGAAGAAAYGAVAYGRSGTCTQAANAYGQIVTQCY